MKMTTVRTLPPIAYGFFGLLLAGTVLEAFVPLLLGAALGAALTDLRQATLLVVVLSLTIGLAIICNVARHVVGGRWRIQRQTQLRSQVGTVIADDPGSVASRVGASDVATVLGSDISRIAGYPIAMMRWFSAVLGLIVVAGYLLWLSVPLALLVLAGVPVFMWITALASAPLEARQEQLRERVGRIAEMSSDIALGLRTLWAVGARTAFLRRLQRENRQAQSDGLRLANAEAVLLSVGVLLPGVLLVGLVAVGGILLEQGVLSPSALVTFYAASAYLVGPIQTTATVLQVRSGARVAQKRYAEVVSAVTGRASASPVQRRYISHVDIGALSTIRPGHPPTADDLAEEAAGIVEEGHGGIRVRVQHEDSAVFSGTVRELVDPRGEAADEEVLSAIHTAAADDVVERFEAGLEEAVGAGGRRLSGGQRQRLILARSLLGAPTALVLAQPTSALDVATEAALAERVTRVREGKTTVVITESAAFDAEAAVRIDLESDR
ncbi:ABC transporter ATP-binding protein [Microbacterium paraoxydans]|uniref:ABC transporter ATP-binding protein n=1 Tax=Microbacterium paraoxydans TaxID=199592 RepID=UPI0030132ED4